jgi:hypothetical protein
MNTSEMVWHDDGHSIVLQISKSELKILAINCPHKESESSPCSHPDSPCVVEWFVSRYGFDCNVGVCAPEPVLDVAWSYIGDRHREIEAGQVWIIPKNDEAFAAWLISQKTDEQEI